MSSEESSRCRETYYTTGKFAVHVFSQGGDTVMKLLVYNREAAHGLHNAILCTIQPHYYSIVQSFRTKTQWGMLPAALKIKMSSSVLNAMV